MKELWKKITTPFSNHIDWWNDYLTEISVIIVSLGITYYGDNLMQAYQDSQDDRDAMQMICDELVANLAELKNIEEYDQKEIEFATLLRKALVEKESIDEDTVELYSSQYRLNYYWFLKKNAFDMVRESGTIQRLDKKLLTQLFECYDLLEVVKDMEEHYRKEKFSKYLLFLAGLPDKENAETTREEWEEIDRDRQFRQSLLVMLPVMAYNSLAANQHAQENIKQMLTLIDEAYPELEKE